ncbi:hypothetical protein DFH11DRAFT_1517667 [Phellopilus nigrolimitatus]|nr:hypothetical protein DFH11DRAFT_1517667 [Phellopilus nigrolimitatus]
MAEYDVYSEQLFSLRNGHALYEPDPAGQDYDKVRIGDVGYVHYGVFHRLFNICYDAHDPINKLGVPEYFEPIHPDDRKEYNRTPLPPGVMSSSSVRRIGGKIGASGPTAVEAGANISLACSRKQGAALLIKNHAYRFDARSLRAFAQCMKDNYSTWRAFAKDVHNRDVALHDIVLVTGCDLTAEWAMATFNESERGASVSFEVGQAPFGSGDFKLWGEWTSNVHVPHRCGPIPTLPPASRESLLITGGSPSSGQAKDNYNQCIFIRGYRIYRRFWRVPKKIKGAAEPKDLEKEPPPPPSDGQASVNSEYEQAELELAELSLPLKQVRDFIFSL